MRRVLILAYGIACYLLAIGTLIWLFLFIGNLGIARGIDGPARMDWPAALLADLVLLFLFALQHSGMARKRVKALLAKVVAPSMERSTYILSTSLALLLIFHAWQPVPFAVWRFEHPIAQGVLYGMFVFGWLTVLVAISLTNHFDLFGVRQAWMHFRARPYRRLPLTTRWLYRYVRHPLYLGWLFAFWSAPVMTAGHLLFALLMSAYIVVAIPWEENDLVAAFGKRYIEYRERVPKLIPSLPLGEDDALVLDRDGRYVGPDEMRPRRRQR